MWLDGVPQPTPVIKITSDIHVLTVLQVLFTIKVLTDAVAYPGILFGGGGVQQIQLRTEDRENWDLGAVAP